MAKVRSGGAPICEPEQGDRDCYHNSADDRPLGLTGHVAAGQYIDALQEEGYARKNKYHAEDIEKDFCHWVKSREKIEEKREKKQ